MNKAMMQRLAGLSILGAAAAFPGAAAAQAMPAMPMAKAAAVEPTDGEVRRLDKEGRKITLKHGEIKSLGMAPMAMQFEVRDRALIDKLKVGDKIRFKAVHEGGKYIVTEIQPAK